MPTDSRPHVLVTGAASGIGRAIAVAFAASGAQTLLFDKDADGLAETRRLTADSGMAAAVYPLDLTEPEEISRAFAAIRQDWGRLDVLVNNAGLSRPASPYELTVEDWDYVINSNLRAPFLCAREAARLMRERGSGRIVNIASTRAYMSEPGWEAYGASKGGIVALTHALAISLGPDGIMVNAIAPGWIATGDYDQLSPTDHEQHPAGRVGRPEDIARACLFLCQPDNDFVTGACWVIDGGMTRKMIYAD